MDSTIVISVYTLPSLGSNSPSKSVVNIHPLRMPNPKQIGNEGKWLSIAHCIVLASKLSSFQAQRSHILRNSILFLSKVDP